MVRNMNKFCVCERERERLGRGNVTSQTYWKGVRGGWGKQVVHEMIPSLE
jgi:hypothetical protein